MLSFLIFIFLYGSQALDAVYTITPPDIDGRIEEVWAEASWVDNFVDMYPREGEPLSEPTRAYVMFDDENLYVAFRCATKGRSPDARVTTRDWLDGDRVYLYLDTFGDRRTAYLFGVSAAGVEADAIISGDGSSQDFSYDLVWYSSVYREDSAYTVEIKIPFRALRYKDGLDEWGINFRRYSPVKGGEDAYWAPMSRNEGFRVSRFGKLVGIRPRVRGRYLEIYPVFLAQTDLARSEEDRPRLGVDLSWSLSPSSRFQFTWHPDFAQVEADPYRLNISKYELYFPEKRPFFTEGADIFKVAAGGRGGRPLMLFYSRRIGKKLPDGTEVPIRFGSKFTFKSGSWESGFLVANTRRTYWLYGMEPTSLFTVFRLKRSFLRNSTLGFLYEAKEEFWGNHFRLEDRSRMRPSPFLRSAYNSLYYTSESHRYYRLLSSDLVLRGSETQYLLQLAQMFFSYFGGDYRDRGALKTSFEWKPRNFYLSASIEVVGDSFDVSELGYLPWKGTRSAAFVMGPRVYPERGIFSYLSLWLAGWTSKESDEPYPAQSASISIFANMVGIGGITFEVAREHECEDTTRYRYWNYYAHLWSDCSKPVRGSFWVNAGKGYYRWEKGYWGNDYPIYVFARKINGGGQLEISIGRRMSFRLSGDFWIQYDMDGDVNNIVVAMRPWIQIALNKNVLLKMYGEANSTGAAFRDQHVFSRRAAFLLSYNFAPKSWIYIGFNDFEERSSDEFTPIERRGIAKIKYLLYF